MDKVINVFENESHDRTMLTGRHRIKDICCVQCACLLGWKYEYAFDVDQRYKEGKYVLELALIAIEGDRSENDSSQ